MELFPSDRVSDDDRFHEGERFDDANDILRQPRKLVSGRGAGRTRVSAARDAIHVVLPGEHWCKVIVDMRGISQAGQEDDGSTGTAPVQHLELNAVIDRHERGPMRRRVAPFGGLLGRSRAGVRQEGQRRSTRKSDAMSESRK